LLATSLAPVLHLNKGIVVIGRVLAGPVDIKHNNPASERAESIKASHMSLIVAAVPKDVTYPHSDEYKAQAYYPAPFLFGWFIWFHDSPPH